MKCDDCGKSHQTVLENVETHEIIHKYEKCYNCLMKEITFKPITKQIILNNEGF